MSPPSPQTPNIVPDKEDFDSIQHSFESIGDLCNVHDMRHARGRISQVRGLTRRDVVPKMSGHSHTNRDKRKNRH